MKYIVLLIGLPLLLFGFTNNQAKLKEKADETIFLRRVESAIILHDADLLMSMMEKDYRRSQHDEFLEGRTMQFLNEFFGAEIEFTDITRATLINYQLQKGSKTDYEVYFKLNSATAEVVSQFFMRKNTSTNTFALYGAVG